MSEEWKRPSAGPTAFTRDLAIAALLGVGTVVSALLSTRTGIYYDDPAPAWLSAIVIAASCTSLAWRRRYPEVVAVVVSLAFFAALQFYVPETLFITINLFLAIYSVGAWGRDRTVATLTRIAIIIGMFVWVAVNLLITVNDPNVLPEVSRSGVFSQFASYAIIQVLTNLLYFGAAFYFGNGAWRSARARAELESRTAELTAERSLTAAQAVALDRVRIARELHDVVAHHVSVMGVQAGAARRVLASDPTAAVTSLETIEKSARSAVDEMHRLLSTLREGTDLRENTSRTSETDAASTSSSTRGVDQLDELVNASTEAGIPATLQIVGSPMPVTALAGFTVYRVAQEALTNTRKHGGSGVSAEVRLRYLDDALEIEVTDTGTGYSLSTSTGLGLIGMRERVAAVGGTLEAGPRSRGGYLVRVKVPA